MNKNIGNRFLQIFATITFLLMSSNFVVAQDEDEPPNPFGVIESYEDPVKADSLGVGWTRVRLQWAEVQAEDADSWETETLDEQIDAEIEAGREVVGLLIGIPEWARDENELPEGLYLPPDDPGNTWAQFVQEAVSRYDGRITHWIIWNEPDISDPETPGHTWDGDVDEFIQLLRIAYLVAKETNSEAVIHLPAITYFWDPDYLDTFFDALVAMPEAAENGYYFDVATAHLYFQPERVYDLVRLFYESMESRGITAKPVWLVETNAPPIDDPYWTVKEWTLSVTLTEQAAFMPQALASALAAGAERIAIYKLKDTEGDKAANPEPFGLVHRDGSRRPAFDTYRQTIVQFGGATAVTRDRWDEIGQFQIYQPGQTTTLLFARLPQAQVAHVPALVEQAALVDMWGKRLDDLVAHNGLFTIELPGALCTQSIGDYCMIGGTSYYLIQDISSAPPTPTPISTPTSLPTATPTATPTPTTTATVTFTPEPTATVTNTPEPAATATETAVIMPTARETAVTPPSAEPPSNPSTNLFFGMGLFGIFLGLIIVGLFLWRKH